MTYGIFGGLEGLPLAKGGRSRSVNAENPTGAKGRGGMASSELGPSRKGSPCLRHIPSGETAVLADLRGPGMITHIWVTVPNRSERDCYMLRDLVLRIYWDGAESPSVETPLGDFFCCGFGRECLVYSLPVTVAPARGMNCYFRMPFATSARITVENQHEAELECLFYQVDYLELDELPGEALYFHAQWRRERLTELQRDYTVLDGVRGRGHYVGTYIAHTALERYWYGEGEMKFYIDGDRDYPTICGTGMEDYFGGAWSFAKQVDGRTVEQTYNSPFLGYPYYSRDDTVMRSDYFNSDTMPQRGFYRWHIADPILFQEDLRVTLQQIGSCHKGNFERQDDIASVAYWYQTLPHQPFAPLPDKRQRWPR